MNLTRYYQLLKRIEWAGLEDHGSAACCPQCNAYAPDDTPSSKPAPGWGEHAADCELAAVLRDVEAALATREAEERHRLIMLTASGADQFGGSR